MVIADLDMALITKRKRMMDSVGHYARPELLSLVINERPAATVSPMPSWGAAGAAFAAYAGPDFNPTTEGCRDERQRDPAGREPAIDD
jgi:nitrilase